MARTFHVQGGLASSVRDSHAVPDPSGIRPCASGASVTGEVATPELLQLFFKLGNLRPELLYAGRLFIAERLGPAERPLDPVAALCGLVTLLLRDPVGD